MIAIRLGLAALVLALAAPAWGLGSGAASGQYAHEGVTIPLSHAIALSQDNTEGLLDHGPQMRVLLSDRDVPVAALYGIAFPPVLGLAQHGDVRGVLLEFNPADRTSLHVTVLDKPADPNDSAASLSLSDSSGLWKALSADAGHVAGVFQSGDDPGFSFSFNAPVSTDPVVADLKGPAARGSEQVRILVARAEALRRGDLPGALALTTRQAGADLAAMPPEARQQITAQVSEMVAQFKAIDRVVVRKATAVGLLGDGSWTNLAFEDGAWKVAD